jgi:NAD+ kinase
MEQFKNIGLIGRMGSVTVVETLRRLKRILLDDNYHLIIEEKTSTLLPGHGMQVCSVKMMGETCDLVIVVGGDGSLLGAARELAKSNVPLLGVNRGHLGFLTDISPDEMETRVAQVLNGHFIEEHRFFVRCPCKAGW